MVLHGSKASSSRKKWLSFVSLFYGLSTIEDNDSQIIVASFLRHAVTLHLMKGGYYLSLSSMQSLQSKDG